LPEERIIFGKKTKKFISLIVLRPTWLKGFLRIAASAGTVTKPLIVGLNLLTQPSHLTHQTLNRVVLNGQILGLF